MNNSSFLPPSTPHSRRVCDPLLRLSQSLRAADQTLQPVYSMAAGAHRYYRYYYGTPWCVIMAAEFFILTHESISSLRRRFFFDWWRLSAKVEKLSISELTGIRFILLKASPEIVASWQMLQNGVIIQGNSSSSSMNSHVQTNVSKNLSSRGTNIKRICRGQPPSQKTNGLRSNTTPPRTTLWICLRLLLLLYPIRLS